MEPSIASLHSPFCGDLRSKKYFFLEQPARTPEQFLDASNDCWCARTQMRVGPDDEIVDVHDCQAGRACFRRAGAERPGLGSIA